MRRGWYALWVAVLFSSRAHATPSMRLTYERGQDVERCPDENVLRKGVEQRLGYDPFFPWANRTIVARIRAEHGKLVGTVELLDESGVVRGSRELSAPTGQCGELISGMALAISIAIDPASVDRVRAAETTTSSTEDATIAEWSAARAEEAPPRSADRAPPRPALRRSTKPATPLQVEVRGGAEVGVAVAPSVAVGPVVNAALRRGFWSRGIEGRFLFGPATTLNGVDVSSSVLEGALLGCFSLEVPFACAAASVGRLAVSGQRSSDALVARVGPRIGARIALSREVAVVLNADLAVNLGTPYVKVGAVEFAAWTASALALLLGACSAERLDAGSSTSGRARPHRSRWIPPQHRRGCRSRPTMRPSASPSQGSRTSSINRGRTTASMAITYTSPVPSVREFVGRARTSVVRARTIATCIESSARRSSRLENLQQRSDRR